MKSLRGTRQTRSRVVGWTVATIVFGFATSAVGQPMYRLPPPFPVTPSIGVATALESQEIWAQAAAYDQYLLYVSSPKGPPTSGQALDSPYFSNGASVTSVPAAGQPGSAYFNNGAVVTSVPSSGPNAKYFTNGAEATRLPLTAPAASVPPAPPQVAIVPPTQPATTPPTTPSEIPASAPPAAVVPAVTVMDEPPMSFEAWIESMREAAGASATSLRAPAVSGAPMEAPPVTESSESANEMRPRATYDLPEKPVERAPARRVSRPWAAFVAGAFALGLLLGILAKRRGRARIGSAHRS